MAFYYGGKRYSDMEMILRIGEAIGIKVTLYPSKPPKTMLSKICDYLFD